jgi:hypothetical protein
MYEPLLFIHSWGRYAVLVASLLLTFHCLKSWASGVPWGGRENGMTWAYSQVLGFQALFGLALFLGGSPFARLLIRDPGQALHQPITFFFAIRHPLSMLASVAVYFVGKKIALNRKPPANRQRDFGMVMLLSTAILFSAVPWAWLPYGRAWVRGFRL